MHHKFSFCKWWNIYDYIFYKSHISGKLKPQYIKVAPVYGVGFNMSYLYMTKSVLQILHWVSYKLTSPLMREALNHTD